MIRIDNYKVFKDLSKDELFEEALRKNKIDSNDVIDIKIVKKSIDARDKRNVYYNYAFDVKVKDENKYGYLKIVDEVEPITIDVKRNSEYKPVIVGSGPAGLFCALTLLDNGIKPIIIEQGSAVDERIKVVEEHKTNRKLSTKCNVQFGEGGAGTFSDGKLTTGISSPHIRTVLEYFYKFGAPEEILYLSKPHIGTDNLVKIVKNIREYIISKGGEYYFYTKFENYEMVDDLIKVNCGDKEFVTDSLVLAIGHSARDTFKMLNNKGILMNRKNFSVGLRIEHKQSMINESQYGTYTKLNLPPAEYKLVYHGEDGRSCYTFCMCPGGEVVASASEEGSIVTNGMSKFKRDGENANSAILVNVLTTDFPGDDPLAGINFQEKLEHDAFVLGGSDYSAPVQRVEDFLNDKESTYIGSVKPSYKPGYKLSNLNKILPKCIQDTLKCGILYYDRRLKGFANPDAILTGVETRSSSPVTIVRNEDLECVSGIYPCGEGAGYAGGITSAAVDGIKVAIKILEK